MKWFVKCLRNYAAFKGRARRAEFWYYTLFQFLALFVVLLLAPTLLGPAVGMIVYTLCALALLVPSLAVAVRRLHDTNRSGKLLIGLYGGLLAAAIVITQLTKTMPALASVLYGLLGFASLGAGIYLLVLFCSAGTPGENRYGEDPKLPDIGEEII